MDGAAGVPAHSDHPLPGLAGIVGAQGLWGPHPRRPLARSGGGSRGDPRGGPPTIVAMVLSFKSDIAVYPLSVPPGSFSPGFCAGAKLPGEKQIGRAHV